MEQETSEEPSDAETSESASERADASEAASAQKSADEQSRMERAREVQDALEEGVHEIEERYRDARDQLRTVNDTAVRFIREHPAACIAGAVAVGYVVGRMASRRWLT